MKRVKMGVVTVMTAVMVLPMLLALSGCIWAGPDDHRDRDRHEDHHEGDRHDEDRGDR